MPTSFLDEARACRRFAHELTGTAEATVLVKIATAFEDLHATRAEPAPSCQKPRPSQVSQRAESASAGAGAL
jgi:hypothetical protein